MFLAIAPSRRLGGAGTWQRVARHAVLALGAVAMGAADACTLDALLRLPLERLMELRVTAPHMVQGALKIDPMAGAVRNEGTDRAA